MVFCAIYMKTRKELIKTINKFSFEFIQSMDFRLRKMEESTQQILSTLAVIHRFMSTHTTLQDSMQGSVVNVHDNIPMRLRTVSETENTNQLNIVSFAKKKKNSGSGLDVCCFGFRIDSII